MTHVITQNCCADGACADVCPVNCIHPRPDEPKYPNSEMLYIDPSVCIDCGACVDVCPVNAISPDYDLLGPERAYIELNEMHYQREGARHYHRRRRPFPAREWLDRGAHLRVAIVGSGPAACYAAQELLVQRGLSVRVDMFERLPVPWGLARYGVAPDHQETKGIIDSFERTARLPGFNLYLNTNVGVDISLEELAQYYNAVIYATGAINDNRLGIPGEDLEGSFSATEFVSWYNGHPDFANRCFNFETERAVIVGNGNVALDAARILVSDINTLARTDIADHALDALAHSRIKEVVLLGRRGASQAAFTMPELLGLIHSKSFHVRTCTEDFISSDLDQTTKSPLERRKLELLQSLISPPDTAKRTITFRFLRSPTSLLGGDKVEGLDMVKNRLSPAGDGSLTAVATNEHERLDCGLVLRSVGYRGSKLPGLPFDELRGAVLNAAGRVTEEGTPIRGAYVTGWIKRGATGVMGTNKKCARETVGALLEDYEAGMLRKPVADSATFTEFLKTRSGLASWRAIDDYERDLGRAKFRPRVKLVDRQTLLKVGRATEETP